MRTPGITGLYQKTYLDNDMYRFDYSHYITGYLDSDDGNFYDEYDHMIPFIRDLDFLDSKENYGHHGFIAYTNLPNVYLDENIMELEDFYNLFNIDKKDKMLIISVLDSYDAVGRTTVLTEINLDEIYKNSKNYYMSFVNEFGQGAFQELHTESFDRSFEDIIKFVKAGHFTTSELDELYERNQSLYEKISNLITDCEILLDEYEQGNNDFNVENREIDFDIDKPYDFETISNLLEKKQLTEDEIKTIYICFKAFAMKLEKLLKAIEEEKELINQYLADDSDEETDSYNGNGKEEKEKYSLDDLKSLRNVVKEYLVGQDEPLRRLVSELSRMKDKNFEDNVGILLSGDSGVGKTFMVQLVAQYLGIPFVRVDSTDLTVPGYVGKDLEEVLWDLYEKSGRDKDAAEHGILFFDEIDKKGSGRKDDISGMGVLNHLLTLIDGNDVTACRSTKSIGMQEEIKLNSKHMIIIAAGSFPDVYKAKKPNLGFAGNNGEEEEKPNKTPSTNVFVEKAMMSSDFMNRLPIRIRLNSLTEKDFEDNFNNGKDSPIKWEEMSFSKHGVKLTVTPDFIKKASELSLKEGSGFRGSKGIILTATSAALDEVKENEGLYEEIVLSDKVLENPLAFRKIKKRS